MRTIASMISGLDRPPVSRRFRRRLGRLAALALVAALAVAAFVPSEPALRLAPAPTLPMHRASNPTWGVAPSIAEQIFRSTTIVRATLQSATAAVETLPGDPGVASTYQAVQELRFTVHEYLKGSGPTDLLVVVRGGHGYVTEAEARDYADYQGQVRVTTWDERQAVLFLEVPSSPYTPAAASGEAAGSSETTSSVVLQFTRSNYGQPPWAYSVDTLQPAWLPAQDAPAEGVTPTAFITGGTPMPPPTITLADLRARIAALAAELTAGSGVEGFRDCVLIRIGHARHRRAESWTPPQEAATVGSGSAAGTDVSREAYNYREPQYSRYWLSGSDSGRFRPLVIDDDGVPSTGYAHALTTTRPLPADTYRVRYNWQHPSEIPCGFAPDDSYDDFTVTVTAPAGTVHEAFFDPAALGSGVVGRDAAQGVLAPAAVGTASGATGTSSATLRRLTWDAGQLRLDVSGTTLAGQQLELIRLDGTVGLTLRGDAATATATAGGHELRWPVCTQPWQPGERLMLRISTAPAGDPPAAPTCPGAPALPTVTVDTTAPSAGAIATLTATVPSTAGAATYQWQRDVGGVWTPVGAAGASYGARAFTATTGTWRVQARYASGAMAHSAPLTLTWPAAATPPCTNGVTVPNPTTNTGLVQDCTALLQARDALAGPSRLNWDGTRALSAWTGVTVGGTPPRVTGLRLGAQDLTGPVPAALGQLTQLTALDLRGNALTGAVPTELAALTRLTALHLAGTRLTGCLPATLAAVATTDAAAQGLAACQAGPTFDVLRYDWIVPAGLPAGAAIGQVQAVDPGGGAVTYALTAGNAAGIFQLNATTGILSVAGALPAGGASLEVQASDARGGATPVPVAVAVADATQQRAPPLFPAGGWTFHVPENAAVGTVVGTAAARDLDGGPLTYALTSGNTGSAFALDASSGALTVAGALDHATTPSYSLTLTATDAHGGSATTTVTITVTDVPPAPAFAAASYAFTVAEDTAAATQVGTVRATVAGGAAVTHTLTAGNTGGAWDLDAATGELKLTKALDYETTPTYDLTIEARSGPAAATVVPVTITVTNVDEPPAFAAASYAFSVAEDTVVTTRVGTVTAADPEGATVIYDITAGDAARRWAVDALAGHLVLANRLDYETTTAYSLTVRALILGGSGPTAAATTTVAVTVTDVLDAPPAPANLAATPAAASLALTWDAVTGASKYQVDYRTSDATEWTTAADNLTDASATVADLTCATAYEVRVRAYGSDGSYSDAWSSPSATLAATTGACPPPAFVAETHSFSVAENSAAATAVGTVAATTMGPGPVTYAITAGNDAAAFALDASTGALTVAGDLDYETTASYPLTVTASDPAGGSSTAVVTVTVTDVDEAPAFGAADYDFSVAEDAATGAAVGTVSAADPEDGTVTYAIAAGNEAETFALDAGTGALTVAAALDYETADSYNLTVSAGDAQGHTATADVAITVTDVVFPPVFAESSYAFSVAEDAAVGAAVGTVGATEPEGGAVTYALTAGNDAGLFAIDAGTGALTVAAAVDHESTSSHSLTVQAASGGGAATATAAVTVTVTDVDEAPAFGAASYAFSVAEDAAVGAAVGTVSATDPEDGTVTYAITAGNEAGAFALDTGTGALTVAAALDHETVASYSLTISASSGDHAVTTTVAVAVTNVDEAPAFGAESYAFSVAEDAAAGAAVGAVTATDPEDGALTYAITAGNDGSAFGIAAATGALTVAGALDYETTTSYSLTVSASDAAGGTATATAAITVTDVDEAPAFGETSYAFSVAEDAAVAAAVGTVGATDPEGGTLTYAITAGNDAGAFALNAASGALTVAKTLDRATTASYSLTLSASDAAGGTAAVTVTITVTKADKPPVFGSASYAFSVADSVTIGTRIGTVSATDPEGATVVYEISAGNAASHWAVDALAGHVVVGAQLNHSTTPSYSLTIKAITGRDQPSATVTVTVTVTSGS